MNRSGHAMRLAVTALFALCFGLLLVPTMATAQGKIPATAPAAAKKAAATKRTAKARAARVRINPPTKAPGNRRNKAAATIHRTPARTPRPPSERANLAPIKLAKAPRNVMAKVINKAARNPANNRASNPAATILNLARANRVRIKNLASPRRRAGSKAN